MIRNNFHVVFVALTLLLLFAATACGSSTTATPVPAPATTGDESPTVAVAPTPEPDSAVESPAGAGRLRVAASLEREVNDPYMASIDAWVQAGSVFEGLTEEPPDLDYRPMLATEWNMSDDGLTWTFNLREGVPFHKGWGDFTAQDVVHSFDRYLRDDSAVSEKEKFQYWRDNMETPDEYTVVIHTPGIEPSLCCDKKIVYRYWGAVLSKAFFDSEGQEGVNREMIGTGPYQFNERVSGSYVLYERVPYDHWRIAPEFDEIQLFIVKESSTRLAMVLAGEAEIVILPFELQKPAIDAGLEVVQAVSTTSPIYVEFGGNYLPSKPHYDPTIPWNNRKVREALNRAVNRQELQDTILGGRGELMAVSFFHSSLPGWNQDWIDGYEDHYGYDPERAKELLQEAAEDMGAPLNWDETLFIITPRPELPELEDVGEAIQNYWKDVGALVKLEQWEFERFRDKIYGDSVENHHNNLAWTDATIRFPDPAMLRIIYYSGGCCHFFESETIDRVYEELQLTSDSAARDSLMREAGNHIFEEYGTLPLLWLSAEFVVNPEVVAEYLTSGLGPPRQLEYVKAVK